ncbi:hypothetical protein D0865_08092 [Hortaea werneckii]|uniref:Uncharacterized protein n=1 Tax=Hortaea werneckii TaxID=91943 RepID=A0A3M7C9L2_HORWE|nr:hypothetical protein D0865_08092 [Hortaea werneckii]
MSFPGDRRSDSSPARQDDRPAPLVIVSERGRHTEASRRIVRAQAARASAAQSRVTRARNRGEREGASYEPVQSPSARSPYAQGPVRSSSSSEHTRDQTLYAPHASPESRTSLDDSPLLRWLPSVLGDAWDPSSSFGTPSMPALAMRSDSFSNISSSSPRSPSDSTKFQLPVALPRGFASLQQRIHISDMMSTLLSRTACVDYDSPGVEHRLHQLLYDLVVGTAGLASQPGHPIQGHLRIACTCLTIFQGQRANGEVFARDRRYQIGLDAAWSEATQLDHSALEEPKSAEASLWAVFIISVTTGATAGFFHRSLNSLLHDLQLSYWEQISGDSG